MLRSASSAPAIARPIIILFGFGMVVLPLLMVFDGALPPSSSLFSAALGSLDVAMNIHAVEVSAPRAGR